MTEAKGGTLGSGVSAEKQERDSPTPTPSGETPTMAWAQGGAEHAWTASRAADQHESRITVFFRV